MTLSVHLVLALASPLRQKSSNFLIISIIWSAYFLAVWTAIFAFGLISNAGCSKSPSYVEVSEDLLALWASFLLIHLLT
ncbi:hypothetical protein MLD38_019328 [Melastoma candidum]|uniref:Uncharacterized protein n=1 Tax=Melastoma candidum TaxID=119954 RepID=A0ACB9QW35_9MYRT|nr:hypothetical protein MLD38_019328 [Melastoma candidum]